MGFFTKFGRNKSTEKAYEVELLGSLSDGGEFVIRITLNANNKQHVYKKLEGMELSVVSVNKKKWD